MHKLPLGATEESIAEGRSRQAQNWIVDKIYRDKHERTHKTVNTTTIEGSPLGQDILDLAEDELEKSSRK